MKFKSILIIALIIAIATSFVTTHADDSIASKIENNYVLGCEAMNNGKFKEAYDLFMKNMKSKNNVMSHALAMYCKDRIDSNNKQFVDYESQITKSHEIGAGTWYDTYNYVLYIPDKVDENTRSVLYYPGSNGEIHNVITGASALFTAAVEEYLDKYAPSSIMVFWRSSGYPTLTPTIDDSYRVLESVARHYGIAIHDLVTAGSSNGGYTALRAAAYIYDNYGIPTQKVLVYDMGMSFTVAHCLPSEDEYDSLAEEQTECDFFEQAVIKYNSCPQIAHMLEKGMNVQLIHCSRDEHNRMTWDGFREGTLSWATGEQDSIREDYYTFFPRS